MLEVIVVTSSGYPLTGVRSGDRGAHPASDPAVTDGGRATGRPATSQLPIPASLCRRWLVTRARRPILTGRWRHASHGKVTTRSSRERDDTLLTGRWRHAPHRKVTTRSSREGNDTLITGRWRHAHQGRVTTRPSQEGDDTLLTGRWRHAPHMEVDDTLLAGRWRWRVEAGFIYTVTRLLVTWLVARVFNSVLAMLVKFARDFRISNSCSVCANIRFSYRPANCDEEKSPVGMYSDLANPTACASSILLWQWKPQMANRTFNKRGHLTSLTVRWTDDCFSGTSYIHSCQSWWLLSTWTSEVRRLSLAR